MNKTDKADLTWELAQVCATREMLVSAMRDIRDAAANPEKVFGNVLARIESTANAALSEAQHFIRV